MPVKLSHDDFVLVSELTHCAHCNKPVKHGQVGSWCRCCGKFIHFRSCRNRKGAQLKCKSIDIWLTDDLHRR